MNQYEHFTSLPPNEEQTFVVYERRTVESGKKAMTLGLIVSAVFGLLTIIVVFSHDKPKNLMADDEMEMSTTSFDEDEEAASESTTETAPEPEPAAAEDAEGDEATEGEATEAEAAEGEAAEAEATE